MSRHGEEGFTLIETVIALAIVALVSVAVLSTVGAELRSAARVREVLPAAALAEERLTALRLLRAEAFASLPDTVASGRFAPPLGAYAWKVEVRPVPGEAGLYDVAVRVDGPGGSYTLDSRIYRRSSCCRRGVPGS
jgi:type II secretion system protein I